LDRQAEQELRRTLVKIGRDRTVIIVTHSPILLAACDDLVAMDKGKVALAGPAKDILPKLFGTAPQGGGGNKPPAPGQPGGPQGAKPGGPQPSAPQGARPGGPQHPSAPQPTAPQGAKPGAPGGPQPRPQPGAGIGKKPAPGQPARQNLPPSQQRPPAQRPKPGGPLPPSQQTGPLVGDAKKANQGPKSANISQAQAKPTKPTKPTGPAPRQSTAAPKPQNQSPASTRPANTRQDK